MTSAPSIHPGHVSPYDAFRDFVDRSALFTFFVLVAAVGLRLFVLIGERAGAIGWAEAGLTVVVGVLLGISISVARHVALILADLADAASFLVKTATTNGTLKS